VSGTDVETVTLEAVGTAFQKTALFTIHAISKPLHFQDLLRRGRGFDQQLINGGPEGIGESGARLPRIRGSGGNCEALTGVCVVEY
jgi:hypothetical protein